MRRHPLRHSQRPFCSGLIRGVIAIAALCLFDPPLDFTTSAAERLTTPSKPRIIVTTDLGADPDDEQSLVRLLVSANEFDIEGLIVSTSCWKTNQTSTAMLDTILAAYAKVLPNLQVHAEGYPTYVHLKSVAALGQRGYGMADVGVDRDSKGSDLIVAALQKQDPRPVWIQFWGGGNTLAQALWKLRSTCSKLEFTAVAGKLRIFDILGQDDAGAWIARNFPELLYIRATEVYGWQQAKNGAYQRNDIQSHGPMGAVYPDTKWATEGDTPAFLHVFPNGLNDPENIDQGGWGGRFRLEKQAGIRSMSEVAKLNNVGESQFDPYGMHGNTAEKVTAIKRWNLGYDNDFAARMDWSVTGEFGKANHHPVAVLNGDASRKVLEVTADAGSAITLDAKDSTDPDRDSLSFQWYFYKEPSSYQGDLMIEGASLPTATVFVPTNAAKQSFHLILELHDGGAPNLYAYRRVIVHVK